MAPPLRLSWCSAPVMGIYDFLDHEALQHNRIPSVAPTPTTTQPLQSPEHVSTPLNLQSLSFISLLVRSFVMGLKRSGTGLFYVWRLSYDGSLDS